MQIVMYAEALNVFLARALPQAAGENRVESVAEDVLPARRALA